MMEKANGNEPGKPVMKGAEQGFDSVSEEQGLAKHPYISEGGPAFQTEGCCSNGMTVPALQASNARQGGRCCNSFLHEMLITIIYPFGTALLSMLSRPDLAYRPQAPEE